MTFAALIFLLTLHYLTGYGFLRLLRVQLTRVPQVCLTFLTGIVLPSFIPFLLQLAYIPITFTSVLVSLVALCLLINIPSLRKLRFFNFRSLKFQFSSSIRIYEWPFMIVFGILLLASLWRGYYQPVFARDMLSGPEVIAEYTIKEHTMVNSFFNVNLETTNNHHKPPYITGLQIIYKYFGFPFGQIWVCFLAIAFCVFLYYLLRQKLHPIIACTIFLLFLAMPELYAYTYILLFDYSNMIFFFLAVYFLQYYFRTSDVNKLYFSIALFGLATFMRVETLVFTGMIVPAMWLYAFRHKLPVRKVALYSVFLVGVPAVIYFLWVGIYLEYYIPAKFHLGPQVNLDLANLEPLIKRFREMHSVLIFGDFGLRLWGYFFYFFIFLTAADIIITQKIDKESRTWWYAVLVIYLGLPILGFLLPLMDLMHTTKRGLFKLLPFMVLILANNSILQALSARITSWELSTPDAKTSSTP